MLGTVAFSDTSLPKLRNLVIWRTKWHFDSIGSNRRNLAAQKISGLGYSRCEVLFMAIQCAAQEGFEISPRFRQTVEERIARLERDAANDEAQLDRLDDIDHIRRQMRLVAAERAEALRMRIFLDRARPRLPKPLIQL